MRIISENILTHLYFDTYFTLFWFTHKKVEGYRTQTICGINLNGHRHVLGEYFIN